MIISCGKELYQFLIVLGLKNHAHNLNYSKIRYKLTLIGIQKSYLVYWVLFNLKMISTWECNSQKCNYSPTLKTPLYKTSCLKFRHMRFSKQPRHPQTNQPYCKRTASQDSNTRRFNTVILYNNITQWLRSISLKVMLTSPYNMRTN